MQPTDPFVIALESGVDAAGVARRFVAEHCSELDADSVDDAILLVSELVTNAVKHGRPEISLSLTLTPPLLGIRVHDQGDPLPNDTLELPDGAATSGRGLFIVDRVASSWGVVPDDVGPGKTVWFRLDAAQ